MTAYSLSLIPHTSDRPNTLLELRACLQRLNYVVDDVLKRVERGVEKQKMRVEALNVRMQVLEQRLNEIKSAAGQTVVLHVPATYPSMEANMKSVFHDLPIHPVTFEPEPGTIPRIPVRWRAAYVQDNDPMVPLAPLIALENEMRSIQSLERRHSSFSLEEGDNVGVTPSLSGLASVFTNISLSSPMPTLAPQPESLRVLSTRPAFQDGSSLSFFPDTSSNGGGQEDEDNLELAYKPKLKEASKLGLPPSLRSIFPNVVSSSAGAVTTPLTTTTGLESSVSTPTIAPITPSSSQQHVEITTIPASSNMNIVAPPPPVPSSSNPPPTLMPTHPANDLSKRDLLAAIRAGSSTALLKPVRPASAEGTQGQNSQPVSNVPNKPQTLADEMREKLLRRQKALSGEQDEEEQQMAMHSRRTTGGTTTNMGTKWETESSASSLPSVAKMKTPMGKKATTYTGKRRDQPVHEQVDVGGMAAPSLEKALKSKIAGIEGQFLHGGSGGAQKKRQNTTTSDTASERSSDWGT